jgi:hypothetical protein
MNHKFTYEEHTRLTDRSEAHVWSAFYAWYVRKEISKSRFMQLMTTVPFTAPVFDPDGGDGVLPGSFQHTVAAWMVDGIITIGDYDYIVKHGKWISYDDNDE